MLPGDSDLLQANVAPTKDVQPVLSNNAPLALPQTDVSVIKDAQPVSNVIPVVQQPVKSPIDIHQKNEPVISQENTTPQSAKDIPQDTQKPTPEVISETVVLIDKTDKKKKEEDSPVIMQSVMQQTIQPVVQNSTQPAVKTGLIVGAQQKEIFVPGMPVEKQVDPQKTTEVFSLAQVVEAPKVDTRERLFFHT